MSLRVHFRYAHPEKLAAIQEWLNPRGPGWEARGRDAAADYLLLKEERMAGRVCVSASNQRIPCPEPAPGYERDADNDGGYVSVGSGEKTERTVFGIDQGDQDKPAKRGRK